MPYFERMPGLNHLEPKMQFSPRRSNSNIGKLADKGTLPKKCLQRNNDTYYRKIPEMSAIILRNSDQRCIFLTLVTIEPDEHLKLFAPLVLSLQGSDQRNCLGSGSEVKMDGFSQVSSSPDISCHGDKQKGQMSHCPPNDMFCDKSFTSGSSASNGLLQSQTRGSVNKRTKSAICNSCIHPNCNLSSDSSGSGHDASIGTGSVHLVKDASKVNKPGKKSSRKKKKKKRRQHKKPSSCSSDIAVMSEGGIRGISALETCSDSGLALGDGCSLESNLSKNETPSSDALHDIIMEKVHNEESSSDIVNLSATTSKATSCSDDLELLETEASLLQASSGDDFGFNQFDTHEGPLITTSTIQMNQTTSATLSGFGGAALDEHSKHSNIHPEVTCDRFSGEYNTPIVDPFSCGWNSDIVTDGSGDVNNLLAIRKENVIYPLESKVFVDCSNGGTPFCDVNSGNDHSSGGTLSDSNSEISNCDNHWSKVVASGNNNCERTECGNQGCISSIGFSVISRKKDRQGRKYPVGSNGIRRVSSVNLHGRAGKETNYSVWQKVEKTDSDKCFFEAMNNDAFTGLIEIEHEKSNRSACLDEISTQTDPCESSSTARADTFSLKSEYDRSRNKVSEKLQREPSSEWKIENGHNLRKGSHSCNAVRPMKMNIPQKESLDMALPLNNYKSCGASSGSSSSFVTDSSNFSSLEQFRFSPLGDVIAVASNRNAQTSQNQAGPLPAVSEYIEKLEVESDGSCKFCNDKPGDSCFQAHNENRPSVQEIYSSQIKSSKTDNKCGSVVQKWVPVGKKEETLDYSSNSHVDDPLSNSWNPVSTKEEQPLINAEMTCLVPKSGSVSYTLFEEELTCETRCDATVAPRDQRSMHIASSEQTINKSKEQVFFINETDSSKILQAVNDAYRLQIESEGVQLVMGSPITEFERFIHSASPVLDQKHAVRHCNNCSGDQVIGGSLCRHQMPNISLGSLWQWYEMCGSYGLEVKAEDFCNSKRFGSGHLQFCAYFVPFLSAVQLFGQSRCSGSAYILSNDSFSASAEDQVCKFSVSSAYNCDSELLFEYFESEPPQQRRPLYEKIQEMIRGNTTSNSQIFGNPSNLECLHLHDLHPSSWYSVAWYPIYRIPDGNFRAAFLTYHSLGHFARSASLDSHGGGASIVSPAVGLQSYNAWGECWFQPRNFTVTQKDGPLCCNPSEILKERLRTLEQTAHVMARACIRKGDHNSVNRQPDYEFFISRRQ